MIQEECDEEPAEKDSGTDKAKVRAAQSGFQGSEAGLRLLRERLFSQNFPADNLSTRTQRMQFAIGNLTRQRNHAAVG